MTRSSRKLHKSSLITVATLAAAALATGVALFAASPTSASLPDSAAERGFAVAARSDRSDRGFGDSSVDLKMVLRYCHPSVELALAALERAGSVSALASHTQVTSSDFESGLPLENSALSA